MSSEVSYFFHGWVFPEYDLIKRVAVSGDEFIDVFGEHQVTDL